MSERMVKFIRKEIRRQLSGHAKRQRSWFESHMDSTLRNKELVEQQRFHEMSVWQRIKTFVFGK